MCAARQLQERGSGDADATRIQPRVQLGVPGDKAAQAWNLKAWLGLVQSDKTMGQRILKMSIAGSCAGWYFRDVLARSCSGGDVFYYRLLNVNDGPKRC